MIDRAVIVNTEDHFKEFVDAVVETGVPFLALFSAPSWCVPCMRLEPHWVNSQKHFPGHMFVSVDMGATPEDTGAHWATKMFGIRGVPQIKLFNDDGVFDIKSRAVVPLIKEIQSHG